MHEKRRSPPRAPPSRATQKRIGKQSQRKGHAAVISIASLVTIQPSSHPSHSLHPCSPICAGPAVALLAGGPYPSCGIGAVALRSGGRAKLRVGVALRCAGCKPAGAEKSRRGGGGSVDGPKAVGGPKLVGRGAGVRDGAGAAAAEGPKYESTTASVAEPPSGPIS